MKILYNVEVFLSRIAKGYDRTIRPGRQGSVIGKAKKAKPLKLTPLTSAYYNIEAHICLFAEDAQQAKNLAAEIVQNSLFWTIRHAPVRSDSFPHLNPNWRVKPVYESPELPKNTAHTPGEWSFSPQFGTPGHCTLAQVWRPDGKQLADIEPTPNEAEATANARLIAAAPDLLAAAQAIVEKLDASIEKGRLLMAIKKATQTSTLYPDVIFR